MPLWQTVWKCSIAPGSVLVSCRQRYIEELASGPAGIYEEIQLEVVPRAEAMKHPRRR